MKKSGKTLEPVRPIDEMPLLAAQLGKAKTDRIRYYQLGADETKQPRSTNLHNTVIEHMQGRSTNDYDNSVSDIIYGVAQSFGDEDKGRPIPLSTQRIYNILQCVRVINTREVMKALNVNQRQAQRYVRAIKFALPFIEQHFLNNSPQFEDLLHIDITNY